MLSDILLELIKHTSTTLPVDVKESLIEAQHTETDYTPKDTLKSILDNVSLAEESHIPICQDTGTPIFHIHHKDNYSRIEIQKSIEEAVIQSTHLGFLRPNAVDPITDINTGNNIGDGLPVYIFDDWDREDISIKLMLKGGGCENCGRQYSLPDFDLIANRDIIGIKKVILDAVVKAQGRGCSPGIIGVGIGGDRFTSYLLSKKQLFRKLDDINPDKTLAEMEMEIMDKANRLGIGPMGFGGKTTLLGVKIGKYHRIPASFFVSISYMCWACRRKELSIKLGFDNTVKEWSIED